MKFVEDERFKTFGEKIVVVFDEAHKLKTRKSGSQKRKHFDLTNATEFNPQSGQPILDDNSQYQNYGNSNRKKNMSTKECCVLLAERSQFILLVTGTIFSNKETDLNELIRVINPTFFPGVSLKERDQYFKLNFPPYYDEMINLSQVLGNIMIRRTYNVLCPGVILEPVHIAVFFKKLSSSQEREYYLLKNEDDLKVLTLTHTVNARKICNISNFRNMEMNTEVITASSTKIQWILHFLKKLSKTEKVVIASHYTKEFAHFLGLVLLSHRIHFCTVDGENYTTSAQAIIDFKGNVDCQIMLLSTTSGGCGLTLTIARFIIIVDLKFFDLFLLLVFFPASSPKNSIYYILISAWKN